MTQKYVAKKYPSPTKSKVFNWSLFRLDPATADYLADGRKRMSLGQLLCCIECADLENWHFSSQKTVCDYTITHYFYPAANSDDCDVELEVVEDHTPSKPRIVRRKIKCDKNATRKQEDTE